MVEPEISFGPAYFFLMMAGELLQVWILISVR